MARFEEKKERTIIFIYEGHEQYPTTKHGYLTDSEWEKFKFTHFDANDREYRYINADVILVFVKKGN